jgi:hypothetical protein
MSDRQAHTEKENKPPKRYWEATHRYSFFDLKFSHWIEILLTIVLGCIAYAQYAVYTRQAGIMDEQAKISNRQLDAMETDKRPWIKAGVNVTKLEFTEWARDRGIFAHLTFDLKNYGDSPAINIRNSTLITPHPGNSNRAQLDQMQKNICDNLRAEVVENPIGGVAIFPNESAQIQSGAGSGGAYKTDDPIIFSFSGCVDYSYGRDRHGQTGFRMILGGGFVKNRLVGLSFIEGSPVPFEEPISPELLAHGYPPNPPKVAVVSPADFVFRPDEGGNYAK